MPPDPPRCSNFSPYFNFLSSYYATLGRTLEGRGVGVGAIRPLRTTEMELTNFGFSSLAFQETDIKVLVSCVDLKICCFVVCSFDKYVFIFPVY